MEEELNTDQLPCWVVEVSFWLRQRGFPSKVLWHHEHFIRKNKFGDDHLETGAFEVDGVVYEFKAKVELYRNAVVVIKGVPGECHCSDQHLFIVSDDDKVRPWRQPGFRWLYNGVLVDADEMRRLWGASKAYPFELPCFDADGKAVRVEDCGSSDVDSDSVLDHLFPHVQKLKLEREMRRKVMANRIQRVWFEVALNPHTPVGRRRLDHEALVMTTLANLGEGDWSEC